MGKISNTKTLINRIDYHREKSADSWVANNNSGGLIPDKSNYHTARALFFANRLAKMFGYVVKFDTGVGLYPTFEVYRNGKHWTEQSTLNFYRLISGFWDKKA